MTVFGRVLFMNGRRLLESREERGEEEGMGREVLIENWFEIIYRKQYKMLIFCC